MDYSEWRWYSSKTVHMGLYGFNLSRSRAQFTGCVEAIYTMVVDDKGKLINILQVNGLDFDHGK